MEINQENSKGGLVISEDVIASIACNAAKDVDGVSSFSSRPVDIVSTIKKGNFKVMSPVRIIEDGDTLIINIYINLDGEIKITPIAEAVQTNVKDAIQNMTGKVVSKVNVIVAGIDFEPLHQDKEPLQSEN